MQKLANRSYLITFVLTASLAGIIFFLAGRVDREISNIVSLQYDIDELTRVAPTLEAQEKERDAIIQSRELIDTNIPDVSELVTIVEQIETIASLTGVDTTIALESGLINDGQLEFEDEKERQEFLDRLNIQETPPETTQPQTPANPSGNVVLQLQQEADTTQEQPDIQANVISINLTLVGEYHEIRSFLSMIEESRYIFFVEEIQFSKDVREGVGAVISSIALHVVIFE